MSLFLSSHQVRVSHPNYLVSGLLQIFWILNRTHLACFLQEGKFLYVKPSINGGVQSCKASAFLVNSFCFIIDTFNHVPSYIFTS